ncbi:hypothetical protein [Pseudomonas mediterranea]|uniref:hypothetical protein n=1 Tax=Pseudomonas mediterranea TaxID=183795 RepID=UPI0006D8AF0D|nr:hypothetical protein [Pseudomonas mediterranea]
MATKPTKIKDYPYKEKKPDGTTWLYHPTGAVKVTFNGPQIDEDYLTEEEANASEARRKAAAKAS